MGDIEFNKLPLKVEPKMADPNQDKKCEMRIRFPIDSAVTDSEIEKFELRHGYDLTIDYKNIFKA